MPPENASASLPSPPATRRKAVSAMTQRVVALAAAQHVGAAVADEHVVAAPADHVMSAPALPVRVSAAGGAQHG